MHKLQNELLESHVQEVFEATSRHQEEREKLQASVSLLEDQLLHAQVALKAAQEGTRRALSATSDQMSIEVTSRLESEGEVVRLHATIAGHEEARTRTKEEMQQLYNRHKEQETRAEEMRGKIRKLKSNLSVNCTRHEADMAAFQEKYNAMLATTSERSLALSEAHRREFEEQLADQARAVGSARLEADAELVHEKIMLMRHKDELEKRIRVFEQRIATLNERIVSANSELETVGESNNELRTSLAEKELKARARDIELAACKTELARLRTSKFDASVQVRFEAARSALEEKERTFSEARSIEERAQRDMEDHYARFERTVKEKVHLEVQLTESRVRETEEKCMREEAEKRENEERAKREEVERQCEQLQTIPLEDQTSASGMPRLLQQQEQSFQKVASLEHEIVRIREAHAREMHELQASFTASQNYATSFSPRPQQESSAASAATAAKPTRQVSAQNVPAAQLKQSYQKVAALENVRIQEPRARLNEPQASQPPAQNAPAKESVVTASPLTSRQETLSVSMLSTSTDTTQLHIAPAHQHSYEQELSMQLARSRRDAQSLENATARLQNSLRLSQTSETRAKRSLQWHVSELERVRFALERANAIVEQFEEQKKKKAEDADPGILHRRKTNKHENLKYLKSKHDQDLRKLEEKFEARLRNERRDMRSRLRDAQDHGEAGEEKLSAMASKMSAHKQAALELQDKLRQNIEANSDAMEQLRSRYETKIDECKQEGELALRECRKEQNAALK